MIEMNRQFRLLAEPHQEIRFLFISMGCRVRPSTQELIKVAFAAVQIVNHHISSRTSHTFKCSLLVDCDLTTPRKYTIPNTDTLPTFCKTQITSLRFATLSLYRRNVRWHLFAQTEFDFPHLSNNCIECLRWTLWYSSLSQGT